MNLVDLLRADGSRHGVVDRRVAPAPGTFVPIGVMVHHTAGSRMHIEGLQRGYGFPGPLCNIGIDLDGTRYVITDGRANDSGMGSSVVLDEVRRKIPITRDAGARGLRDDINLNPYFYDIEVVNDGRGQHYPTVQIDSLVATCAALCRAHDWPAQRCIHHRQATRRKIDMSWRGDLTGMVARALDGEEEDMSEVVEGIQRALTSAGGDPGPVDGVWGPRTEGALATALQHATVSEERDRFFEAMHRDLKAKGARPSSLGHMLDWYRELREQHPTVPPPGPS